jgi:hypothetical protein
VTQIMISDGVTYITMPQTKKVTDVGAVEYKEIKMAGGKLVREMIGFRPGFRYDWDYVPASTIADLIAFLRTGAYFTVAYFDVDGTEKSGLFSITYPTPKVFKFVRGVAMWHGVSITITAQEVVR